MTASVDVLIVGGGPAGAVAAAAVAPHRSVLVVERSIDDHRSVGETLAPAAARVLAGAGLPGLVDVATCGSVHLRRWAWGGTGELDAICDPEGPHRLVDRREFDSLLRQAAVQRGATLTRGYRLADLERRSFGGADSWLARISDGRGRTGSIAARVVIDATGRPRSAARRLGAGVMRADQLVCRWVIGSQPAARPGVTDVAAAPDGWWYSTALPGDRRLLAWHTDVDAMPHALAAETGVDLVTSAGRVPEMAAVLDGFRPDGASGVRAAGCSRLDRVAGEGWLAVGDAAIALDPLTSQGLFAALFTGLAAAATIDDALDGGASAWSDYQQSIEHIWASNCVLTDASYSAERRWPDRTFWRRRHVRASERTGDLRPVVSQW